MSNLTDDATERELSTLNFTLDDTELSTFKSTLDGLGLDEDSRVKVFQNWKISSPFAKQPFLLMLQLASLNEKGQYKDCLALQPQASLLADKLEDIPAANRGNSADHLIAVFSGLGVAYMRTGHAHALSPFLSHSDSLTHSLSHARTHMPILIHIRTYTHTKTHIYMYQNVHVQVCVYIDIIVFRL